MIRASPWYPFITATEITVRGVEAEKIRGWRTKPSLGKTTSDTPTEKPGHGERRWRNSLVTHETTDAWEHCLRRALASHRRRRGRNGCRLAPGWKASQGSPTTSRATG